MFLIIITSVLCHTEACLLVAKCLLPYYDHQSCHQPVDQTYIYSVQAFFLLWFMAVA